MAKFEYCAPITQDILLNGSIAIADTATVYTESWVLHKHSYFGIELQFSSDTDVNIKVELEQGNYAPTTQGASDSNFTVAIDTIDTITDESVHIYPIAPVVAIYGRLKLTGQTGNGATTKLTRANWTVVEA